jgi:predicted ATPase
MNNKIEKLQIKNYKSIQKQSIKLSQITVLIGENGAGKSNLLEAITLAGAASADKLDNEFLVSRGLRSPAFHQQRSLFQKNEDNIEINIITSDYTFKTEIDPFQQKSKNKTDILNHNLNNEIEKINEQITEYTETFANLKNQNKPISLNEIEEKIIITITKKIKASAKITKSLKNFLIYSPSYSTLRTFQSEGQILPLGIRGEGLFAHLQILKKEEPTIYKNICEQLNLIGWYGGMDIPADLPPFEAHLDIKDRFISEDYKIDQSSLNEGFFFLLFYFTLILSPHTPPIFAIDNLDTSLNPRLCKKLMTQLVESARKNEKQIIITTHNPAILDGINLHDPDQSILVVKRDSDGHTVINAVPCPKPSEKPIPLSEAFMRGYIGGLPDNF